MSFSTDSASLLLLQDEVYGRTPTHTTTGPGPSTRYQEQPTRPARRILNEGSRSPEASAALTVVTRNILLLSLGFGLLLGAFHALHFVQTAYFIETSVGTHSLIILYITALISGIWSVPMLSWFISTRAILVTGFISLTAYMSCFFYPQRWNLFVAAVLAGIALGPLVTVQWNAVMMNMHYLMLHRKATVLNLTLLRNYNIIVDACRFIACLLTATVVSCMGDVQIFLKTWFVEETFTEPPEAGLCQVVRCEPGVLWKYPWHVPFVTLVSSRHSLVLVSLFFSLCLLGFCLVHCSGPDFAKQLPKEQRRWNWPFRSYCLSLQDATLGSILLVSYFVGLLNGFMFTDFVEMILSCSLSFISVSLVMSFAAGAHLIIGWAFAALEKIMSRPLLCCIAVTTIAGLLAVMCLWLPVNDDPMMFFVMGVAWGISTGFMDALTTTFIAREYPTKWPMPFALRTLGSFFGLATAFCTVHIICLQTKLSVLTVLLPVAVLQFALQEHIAYKRDMENKGVEPAAI